MKSLQIRTRRTEFLKTSIIMVRHADSPFIFGEERTRGLSEEGFADAKRVADLLSQIEIDHIISSPYIRAIQTVQYLADNKGLPVILYEELIERSIKGLDYKAIWDLLFKAIEKSFIDLDYALEGGESTRMAQKRAIPTIEEMLKDYHGKTVIIGTHGNIMTIIMNHYNKNYGFDFWNSTSKPDIYKMTFQGQKLESIERLWNP
jgi:2,3-bisphosphoglycerate-dependent phosphoglycerate mutase